MGEARRRQRPTDGEAREVQPPAAVLKRARGAAQRGDLDGAITLYSQVVQAGTTSPDVFNDLGVLLARRGQFAASIIQFEMALMLAPAHGAAKGNLITALESMSMSAAREGRWADAATGYRRLTDIAPDTSIYFSNAGAALRELGQAEQAIPLLRRARAMDPDRPNILHNLGSALLDVGLDEAEGVLARAVQLDPLHVGARINLALVHDRLGRLEAAAEVLRAALAIQPADATAHANLASVLREQGEGAASLEQLSVARDLAPQAPDIGSSYLLTRQADPTWTPQQAFLDHRSWGRRFADPLDPGPRGSFGARDADPDRRLRVGYVSPDLRRHPVASFCEPLLAHHDRSSVEIFCYSDAFPDAVTQRIKARVEGWCDTRRLGDAELAARIVSDRVDVLVDLAGHTAGNRLLTFARRPAPVQVTYCGYPDTTGMAAMGWRITDAQADPDDPAPAAATSAERLWRVPTGFLCFQPPSEAPEPQPPPVLATGRFTFGSFNNWAKVGAEVIETWARILQQVPDSALLLKSRALTDVATANRVRRDFARYGVDGARILTAAYARSPAEHFARYAEMDLALDTFPYCGTTTTCEALWMGVPVVSLSGDRHVARVGAALLSRVGLDDLVTHSRDQYIARAVALASGANRSHLTQLRHSLRFRVVSSPLVSPEPFARSIELAFRSMWRAWCTETTAQ